MVVHTPRQPLERRSSIGCRRSGPKDVLRHGLLPQPGQLDLASQAPREKRLAKQRQRAVRLVPTDGSEGRDQEQPRGIHARSHVRDPVEGRRVAPVEVLDRKDEGVVGRERFDRIGQLPQHPIPDRPHEPLLKGGRLARSKNARELREPHRRVALERRDRPIGSWTPTQPHEGIEERLIRLAAAVLLDAVGPRHRDALPLAQPGEPFLQDGTLSDPGLAADQADLTGPLAALDRRRRRSGRPRALDQRSARLPGAAIHPRVRSPIRPIVRATKR